MSGNGILIRKPYDPALRVSFATNGPSRTKQAEAAACDINNILARYRKTGVVEHLNRYGGDYADFTGVQDYQASLNQVLAAREVFDSLPSQLRRRFGNDPATFLEFVGDEANRDEMKALGLLREVVPAPDAGPGAGGAPTPEPGSEGPSADA